MLSSEENCVGHQEEPCQNRTEYNSKMSPVKNHNEMEAQHSPPYLVTLPHEPSYLVMSPNGCTHKE